MRVRLKDIADQVGVSVVTVSKVLQNYPDVSEETRKRVLAKAKELGYQPNWAARSLVTRKSFTIGMVLPHLRHTFFQEAYRAITGIAAPKGYTVLMTVSHEDPQQEEKEIDQLLARQVDGLLIASTHPYGGGEFLQRLEERGVPYVLLDREFRGRKANFVGIDDRALGMMATRHLIEQGCRHIAHLRGPEVSTAVARLEGYRQALAEAGLAGHPHYVAGGKGDDDTGYWAMQGLLKTSPRPDGVFCYNDPVAAGAMRAALEAGLRVPDDIAIIGAGNMHYSDLFRVPLSTIDQRSEEVGARAGELILDLVTAKKKRREPRRVLVSPRLVVRESSRRKV